MRIVLLSNINDRCGIAAYADDLINYRAEEVEYRPVSIYSGILTLGGELSVSDLLHINYYHGLQGIDMDAVINLAKSQGKPVVVTNHGTNHWENWFNKCDVLVTHEKPDIFHENNVIIPMGIPEKSFNWRKADRLVLCQAGFPFPWKNYYKLALAANQLRDHDPSLLLFMPNTSKSPVGQEIDKCLNTLHPSIPYEIYTEWIPTDELIRRMHNEASVLVWYTDGSNGGMASEGPSASACMAIAAKRPIIVNGHATQYRGILGAKGVYPVYGYGDLAKTILKAHQEQKYAKELINQRSFYKIGHMYRTLYYTCGLR